MKIFYTSLSEKHPGRAKTKKTELLLGGAALVFLLGLSFPGASMGRTVDRIIAVVNGEALTYSELDMAVRQARIGLLGLSPEENEGELFERNVLSRLIDRTIQLQLAQRAGISVENRDIDLALDDVKKTNGIVSNDQLAAVLAKEGLTLDEYRTSLRDQISIIKLMNREVKAGVVLGQTEMKKYYEDHKNQFRLSESFHLRQILLPGNPPEDPARTAAAVHTELESGASFDDLLRKYSRGPTAEAGGDLGWIEKDLMQPQIRQAVENLLPGQFSEPVQTPAGFHVFLLEEKSGSEPAPFDEVKDQIRELLFRERTQILYEAWLKNIRAISQVEVKYK